VKTSEEKNYFADGRK